MIIIYSSRFQLKGVNKMKAILKYLCYFLVLFLIKSVTVYGLEFIDQKGVVGSTYTITYEGKYAMISRDGSPAHEVKNNTIITKPGRYYLNVWDQNNNQTLTCFVVSNTQKSSSSNQYRINSYQELREAFKQIIETYQTNVSLEITYDTFSLNQLNNLFSDTLEDVIGQYPLLSYEGYTLKAPNTARVSTVTMRLKYADNYQPYQAQTLTILHQLINKTMTKQLKDFEREWLLYDKVAKRTSYSKQVVDGKAPAMTHTVQGTIIDQVAVCDGYAKTLMYLLNAVGVPTQLVYGSAVDNGGATQAHAWNLVKIQGQYYHVDPTWGDLDEQQMGMFYDYFNETDDYMARTHIWQRKDYPTAQSTQYTLLNMPIVIENVYAINTVQQWTQTLAQLKKNRLSGGTFLLSGSAVLSKGDKKLLTDIVTALNSSVEYTVVNKYGTKIIYYRLAK